MAGLVELLSLIPALPLAGFLVLAIAGGRLPGRVAAAIGICSVGLSAAVASAVGVSYMISGAGEGYRLTLWKWIDAGSFSPDIVLYLDGLSLVMVLVITWVGFLIHLYSSEFMEGEEGYSRFFAYMNLFVASMLVLVLAGNLPLLYLGWEGVGLCSYLLIGFWYTDPANGRAARKAFVVTRVGDAALALGIFLIFHSLGTTDIQRVAELAGDKWVPGAAAATLAAALLLAGALGKSAQLPLQTWLPDAMAGPSPVSALIHAATMVTAGVYLIARNHVIFTLAPDIQHAVAVVGALTLLLGSLSAMVQRDIKRVLAYSTMSQIGYMFLALGVGAWSAAIFHFMTHAFFKALLFLCAGAVISALGREHDIFRMGGLKSRMPLVFWSFVAGAASLSALPLVTAGFYSKDMIILGSFFLVRGSSWLWGAGLVGAFLTSLYTFRVVFVVFFGKASTDVTRSPGLRIAAPLIMLAVLSVVGGFIDVPGFLGTSGGLPPEAATAEAHGTSETLMGFITSVVSILGIYLAYVLYMYRPSYSQAFAATRPVRAVKDFLFSGLGFDRLYDAVVVRPFLWLALLNRDDAVDLFYTGAAWYGGLFHRALSMTQSGKVRWYAMGLVIGAVFMMGMVLFS